MRRLMKAVYDVDDTLWGLNEQAYKLAGLTVDDAKYYRVQENPLLTDEQRKLIMDGFCDPEVFKRCVFYEGYTRIFDIDRDGKAHVHISSANTNFEVMNIKKPRLINEVPNIKPDNIKMTILTGSHLGQEREPGDILVDDNILNIIKSNFPYNILMSQPHNRNIIMPFDKNIIRVESLMQAVDIVESIIEKNM